MNTCSEPGCEETKLKARGLCPKHYTPAKRLPPQALKPSEYQALLDAAAGPRWQNVRDVALIQLLAHSGLRIDEALSLTVFDIDWDDAPKVTLFVAHGKGDKSRKVALGQKAHDDVHRWLAVRQDEFPLTPSGGPLLFPSASGKKLDDSQVRRLFRRLGKKAGITKRVHPHGLRHTFSVEAVKAKKRPELLQRQLGHTNLGTTTRYLSTIAPEEVIDEMWDL